MIQALLLIARWIGLAHDRWRARVCHRRPLAGEVNALRELVAWDQRRQKMLDELRRQTQK